MARLSVAGAVDVSGGYLHIVREKRGRSTEQPLWEIEPANGGQLKVEPKV